ncbi:MAG TPA: autotransporter-associated beta strand repeat-containing protein, partial [Candidatus Paceibacterota bacterium]|nr:autotransporter-associated beta strand repeat-containing protein [Candidatus Paceibacterota bacterium]
MAANVAFGQTTRSWTGGAGDFKLATAGNWNPSGSPAGGSSDILQWDGTAATGNLLVTNASALDASPGLNLNVTAEHTGSLTIVGTARLRLNNNSLAIASGAGAFSFGNGAAVAFPIPLAGSGGGAVHAWTNNSAYTATINSEVYFLMGGGGAHTLALGGTGNWNVYSQLQAQNGGAGLALTVNGSGTVVYAPTNAPATTYSGVFNGITVTSGTLKLGNAAASSGTITVNGGTLDINGFSITNNLSGAGSIDTTAAGGIPVLTISNANNPTISGTIKNTAGTLSLVKRGAGTLTLAGANTYSGATTVSAGTVIVNGSIGSGDVTVASGAGFGGGGSVGGSVTWQAGSSASFVVTNTGSGNGTPLLIGGSATLNNNAVSVNVLGSTPLPLGTYVLMNATGGSSGSFVTTLTAANFTGAGVAPGTAASISMSGGVATLHVDKIGTDSTWINDLAGGTGTWSTSSSWENGYVPSLAGDVATLGVGSSVSTVTLDANISLGGINFTNPNSFIVADSGKTLTLDAKGNGVTVTVSGGASNSVASAVSLNDKVTYAVAGGASLSLSGVVSASSTGLTVTKNGNGTLVLSGNNTYGPAAGSIGTVLGGGNLEIANSHALGAGDLTNSANATMTFGTAVSLPNKIWINSASTLTLNDLGNMVAFTGGFGGAGSLYKNSAGLNVITNNGTSTIATITVTNGTLEIAPNTTVLATGQLFVDNGGTLQVDAGSTLSYTASGFGFIGNTTGAIATNIINGTLNYSNANFVVGRSGGGIMTINSGRFLCNNFFVGQSSAADSGYLYLNGGSLIVNNVQSGGGANYFYFNGGALVAKAASTTFWANNTALNAYVQGNPGTIDNGGNAITISQPIYTETGADGGMIFQGTNVTTLASANGYNGPTVVNAGRLFVTGSIGGGDVTVASGASLGGTGTVGGNVTFQTGASAFFVVTNTAGGNGTPFIIGGTVSLNSNPVTINVAGSTPLPVGIYTLMYSAGNTGSFAVTPTFTGAGVAGGTVSTVSVEGGVATLTVLVGGNTWAHDG